MAWGSLRAASATSCPTRSRSSSTPSAGDVMMDAAVKDILDKLARGAELLHAGAISSERHSTAQPDAGTAGPAPGRLPAPEHGSGASQSDARKVITYYV